MQVNFFDVFYYCDGRYIKTRNYTNLWRQSFWNPITKYKHSFFVFVFIVSKESVTTNVNKKKNRNLSRFDKIASVNLFHNKNICQFSINAMNIVNGVDELCVWIKTAKQQSYQKYDLSYIMLNQGTLRKKILFEYAFTTHHDIDKPNEIHFNFARPCF